MIFTPLFVKNFSLLLIFLIDSFGQFCMIVVLTSTNAISDYHHYNQWLTTTIWLSPLQSMTITTTISDYHHYNQWLSPLQSVAITTTISDYHHYNQWLTTTTNDYHHYNQWLSPLQSVTITTTYAISAYHHKRCEFESRSCRGVLETTLCDKVCLSLAARRWFSQST